jgi:hypothetical protein
MSEESKEKGKTAEKEKSFWKTIPGLLTGIAAIITAISGLLVALSSTGLLKIAPTPTVAMVTQTPISLPTNTATLTVQPTTTKLTTVTPPSSTTDCLENYLADVPVERVSTVEVGTQVMQLIAPNESMEEIIAIQFEALRTPLGAMKFYAFPENRIFKIVEIVDSNCQKVGEYEPSESPDKNTLGYYEDLNLNLNGTDYILLLSFYTNEIYLEYFYNSHLDKFRAAPLQETAQG